MDKLAAQQLHYDLEKLFKLLEDTGIVQKFELEPIISEVRQLPEIKGRVEISNTVSTSIEGGVSITNLAELKDYFDNLADTIAKSSGEGIQSHDIVGINTDHFFVTVDNFVEITELLDKILKKPVDVTVDMPQVSFPKNPSEAVAVRLVDVTGSKFYNAVSGGGGGGSNVPVVDNRVPTTPQSFIPTDYDYLGVTYPNATTEVYTYRKGGSSGTVQATVTAVYTDSTKDNVSSVSKT